MIWYIKIVFVYLSIRNLKHIKGYEKHTRITNRKTK